MGKGEDKIEREAGYDIRGPNRCQTHAIPFEMFARCVVSGMFDYVRIDNFDNWE